MLGYQNIKEFDSAQVAHETNDLLFFPSFEIRDDIVSVYVNFFFQFTCRL